MFTSLENLHVKSDERKTCETSRKVSIGLPVYNAEKTIRAALESLLNQTYQNFELIVSDNASTDRTAKICAEYASSDRRIRFFQQPRNRGAWKNFFFVLSHAHEDYFMWAAADDLWKPGFIDTCLRTLDANPQAGLAMTGWEIVGRWSGPFFRAIDFPSWSPLSDQNRDSRLTYFIELDYLTHKANFFYGLWHRDLAIKSMGLFEDIPHHFDRNGGDIAILTYALGQRSFAFIPDVMFFKMYKYLPLTLKTGKIFAAVKAVSKPWRFLRWKATKNRQLKNHQTLLKISLKALGLNPQDVEILLNSACTKF